MSLRFKCPACQTAFACPPDHLGQKLRCTQCGKTFTVKTAPPSSPAARAPAKKPRKKRSLGMTIAVAGIAAVIIGFGGYVAVSWYQMPSGPAGAPPGAPTAAAPRAGVPQGYDQVRSPPNR
jgi:predicted Zn finger-like uncharacterized protein